MDTSRRGFLGIAAAVAVTTSAPPAAAAPPPGKLSGAGDLPGVDLPSADLPSADLAGDDLAGDDLAGVDQPTTATLTPFVDALRVPPTLRPMGGELTVEMRAATKRLHSQLPPTRLWTYDGHFPGPTIDVRTGRRLRVTWTNRIDGETVPVTAVQVFGPDTMVPLPITRPGRDGAVPREDVAAIPPWLAVHVHGSVTGGGNDGWAENGIVAGEAQLSEYLNQQPSATLWYHDHAMHTSSWTIFAGLVGMYVIRDDEEAALDLPRGPREIPLILCDRNLDTDEEGLLTGRLLHKVRFRDAVQRITRPFEGPYTLVNGTIWPYLDVDPRWYRFRVLNASNSRTFRLALVDETTGRPVSGVIKQIGTDAGLLPTPLAIDSFLTLAAAERADLLVDFTGLRGRRLRLVNTVADATAGRPTPDLPYPEVMQFRVADRRGRDRFTPPTVVSPGFVRTTHESIPHHHDHRVVLTKVGGGKHAEMWEMAEIDGSSVRVPGDGVVQIKGPDGQVRTYKRIASGPDDMVNYFAELGKWEYWTFINAADFMHPMHIHLMRFQALSRDIYDISGFDGTLCGTVRPIAFQRAGVLEANERGLKDVIRVGPAEVVTLAGRFEGATGRFAYHCHMLEHQDEGMMRPLVVFPPGVMALRGGHHHA